MASTLLKDFEDVELAGYVLAAQGIAGLCHEVRHIDHAQRISAFEDDNATDRHAAKSLLGAQHDVWTAKLPQIKQHFVDARSWSRLPYHEDTRGWWQSAGVQCRVGRPAWRAHVWATGSAIPVVLPLAT